MQLFQMRWYLPKCEGTLPRSLSLLELETRPQGKVKNREAPNPHPTFTH